jgi:hypothetical protein
MNLRMSGASNTQGRYEETIPNSGRKKNMLMSPVGLGTKSHCTGEGQQNFSSKSIWPTVPQIRNELEELSVDCKITLVLRVLCSGI